MSVWKHLHWACFFLGGGGGHWWCWVVSAETDEKKSQVHQVQVLVQTVFPLHAQPLHYSFINPCEKPSDLSSSFGSVVLVSTSSCRHMWWAVDPQSTAAICSLATTDKLQRGGLSRWAGYLQSSVTASLSKQKLQSAESQALFPLLQVMQAARALLADFCGFST